MSLSADRKLPHLLRRITFGPRPGDVEALGALGVRRLLDRELEPEKIDDAAIESRLAGLPTLTMTSDELVEAFPPPRVAKRNAAARDAQDDAAMMAEAARPRQILVELARQQVLRAVYGRRQLHEVMVQFWMNHFNIFAPKGADKWLLTSFERDTIRPHALGNFEDLLVATAKSPAMLFYLDNWLSAAPHRSAFAASAPNRERTASTKITRAR